MEELGRDCAEFLAQQLRGRNGITDIGNAEREDWGWSFDVTLGGEMYVLNISGTMGPQPIYWWSVQILPIGFFSWLLRRPRKHFAELLKIVDQVLISTVGISDVTWTTVKEYLLLPDVQTLEAKRKGR
ncbi:MAG TPA: hypothetical protein VFB96_06490 [Pirellulaceae bacterium]|nr:hypothetical protein [Pirellulaceae bacterium]